MSGEPNDLWPEKFEAAHVKSPEEVLAEQAELLGHKTHGVVIADLEEASDFSETKFGRRFVLIAPELRGYRYVLFRAMYPVTMYPVEFYDTPIREYRKHPGTDTMGRLHANTEEELREVLKEILGCKQTGEIIASLMAQCEAKQRLKKHLASFP